MKGKKIDRDFISDFIAKCISEGKLNQEEMIDFANKKINEIDEKIKEVEDLKIIRSKLLDVLIVFKSPEEKIDNKYLDLFNINNKDICNHICKSIQDKKDIFTSFYPIQDIIINIDQLIKLKVISKRGDNLFKGSLFKGYFKYIICEEI